MEGIYDGGRITWKEGDEVIDKTGAIGFEISENNVFGIKIFSCIYYRDCGEMKDLIFKKANKQY